ncbi:MAG TPA: hypothetical protein VLA99_00360, partial [Nitrospiraceae bacterium]|nr:hypothetical protein [Nitrospiraceae bacterium]
SGMRRERLAAGIDMERGQAPQIVSRLTGSGIRPSSKGRRITDSGARPMVIDGPFAETKELIGSGPLIRARSRDKEER